MSTLEVEIRSPLSARWAPSIAMLLPVLAALLLGCGGDGESAASTEAREPSTEATANALPEAEGVAEGENHANDNAGAPAGAQGPPTNRSAGPVRARFAVMSARAFSGVEVIAPFARKLAVGASDGTVAIFDVPSGHVRAVRRVFAHKISALLPSTTGTRILILGQPVEGDFDHAAVWDLETDEIWHIPQGDAVYQGALSPDGTRFALLRSRGGQSVMIGAVRGAIHQHEIEARAGPALVFSDDGDEVVVVAKHVHRFDARTGRPRGTPWELTTPGEVALSPRHVAVARERVTSAQVWNVAEPVLAANLSTRSTGSRVRWSPDGSILLVRSFSGFQLFGGESFSMLHEGNGRLGFAAVDFREDHVRWASLDRRGATFRTSEPDAEPIRFELGRELERPHYGGVVAFPRSDSHFFFAAGGDVYIANIARRRARRLARGGGWSEDDLSIWSVHASERGVRVGSLGFGALPNLPQPEGSPEESTPAAHAQLASRSGHTLSIPNPFDEEDLRLELRVTGRPEPIEVSAGNFQVYCDVSDDSEHDEAVSYQWHCSVEAEIAPDGSGFLLQPGTLDIGGEANSGVASYDGNGRRVGFVRDGSAEYGRDGRHIVLRKPDGGLALTGPDLRTRATVLRGRPGHHALYQFNESSSLFAATRGAALVIHDVVGNARKHAISMPGVPRVAPRFVDEDRLVQVQLRDAFIWYSVADGSEARRVELDDIRGLNGARDAAVHCSEGRLRRRVLAREESLDLGPCPHAESVGFDDARAWWSDGSVVTFVRFSDGQRLHLARVPGRRPLRYAYTPEGQVWVSEPSRLAALRIRREGPVLGAELGELGEAQLVPDLVERFVGGRPLTP